jgi:uncharacterized protein
MSDMFWSAAERRPRLIWRLLLQGLILLTATLFFGTCFSLPLLFIPVEGSPPVGDPESAIQNVMANPVLFLSLNMAFLFGVVASVWAAGRFLDKRPFRDFGFHFSRLWWLDFLFGLVLGALLMALIFAAEYAAGWVNIAGTFVSASTGFIPEILIYVVLFLSVGISEELWTRGYQLTNLAEGFNLPRLSPRAALLLAYFLSSAFFGVLHALNPNSSPISTFNLVLAGLFLGLGYVLTRQLALPIGLHITWNFFQGNVFGFPVSGSQPGASFLQVQQGGPDLWTGGAFGPEAGLTGLFAMALGSVLIYAWVRLTRGQARLQSELAVYNPGRPGKLEQA